MRCELDAQSENPQGPLFFRSIPAIVAKCGAGGQFLLVSRLLSLSVPVGPAASLGSRVVQSHIK